MTDFTKTLTSYVLGPPKRVPGAPTGGPAKAGPTKEEQLDLLEAKVNLTNLCTYLSNYPMRQFLSLELK